MPVSSLQTICVRLHNQSDFMEALKATLSEEVLRVRLVDAPPQKQRVLLEITGRTDRVVVFAEVLGPQKEGSYPLRLKPRSDDQFGELFAIIAKLEAERHQGSHTEPEDPLEAELMEMGAAMPEGPLDAPAELEELGPADGDFAPLGDLPFPEEVEDTMTPVLRPTFGTLEGTSVLELPPDLTIPQRESQTKIHVQSQGKPPAHDSADDLAATTDPTLAAFSHPVDFDDATLERSVSVETLAPDPLLGRKVAGGKYEIESLVGSGASGAVYKAKHIGLRRAVAIKVLHPHFQADPEFMKRFHREALAASQLDHPNIMRVLDFGQESDGLVYIVMEFLQGGSLQARLHEEGKFTPERAVHTVSQVLSALAVAHEQGIIHRDVKPENIVIVRGRDEEGGAIEVVKVCDFGIAALQNTHPDDPTPQAMAAAELAKSIGAGYLCGTPEYMAPEQARGEITDARSDVYACACTLYELLTGRTPFEGMAPMEIIVAQSTLPVPQLGKLAPNVPAPLEAVIMKALSKSPDARPQNARAFRSELREALEAAAPKPVKKTPSLVARSSGTFDVEAGLSAFVMFFASAVLGTGAFRKENEARFGELWRDGQKLLSSLLDTRREITFVRRDTERAIGFFALLGDGEAIDLKKLFGKEGYEKVGASFVTELARPGVAALTLQREVTDAALAELTAMLALRPEDAARAISQSRLTGVSAIFPNEIVGRDRKLSWKVGLSASRLARDLAVLQQHKGANADTLAAATHALVSRSTRMLTKAEELRQLLVNIDLGAARGARIDGLAAITIASLTLARCMDVASLLVADLDQKEGPERERSAGLLGLLGHRLVRERTPEMFEVLCEIGVRGIMPLHQLPNDVAMVIRAEQLAETIARSPDKYLANLAAQNDDQVLQAELTVLKGALKILAKRGEANALLSTVGTLARMANNKGQTGNLRERMAFKVITSIVDEERLVPVANVLMVGQPHAREAARQLLSLAGEAGARALVRARTALREPTGRAPFVMAMKGMGPHGSSVVAKTLSQVDIVKEGVDLAFVEDLLRAVPAHADAAVAGEISKFLRHRTLRGVALYAYAEVSGDRAKEIVMDSLEHPDESVRAAALFAAARLNAVDDAVIATIEKLFARPGAGEPVRRAAATALGSAQGGSPRTRAVGLLSKLVEGKAGLLSKLRQGEPPVEEPMLVLDAARSLLALDRAEGIKAILSRSGRASRNLATELDRLMETSSQKRG